MKKTWEILNSALGKKPKSQQPKKIVHNGIEIDDGQTIVNTFNRLFINAGKDTRSKIPNVTENFSQYMPINQLKAVFLLKLLMNMR